MEPDGDIQKTQTDHGKAHNATGREGDVQPLVQALGSSLSGAGVGIGGDLHADEAGQAGVNTTGQESEGDKPAVQHAPPNQNEQDDEDDDEHLEHRHILMLQIRICTLADSGGDLFHGVRALRVTHDLTALHDGEEQCDDSAHEANPEKILSEQDFQLLLNILRRVFTQNIYYHIAGILQVFLGGFEELPH